MLCLSGFELSSRWVPLKDVLVCKKMAPFAMNASKIERFAALTTQRQKDFFEVNKNLTEQWFWHLRRWKKSKINECCLHAMVCCTKNFTRSRNGPDFAGAKKFTQHSISSQLFYSPQRVYHCTQEIIIMTKEMANGYIIT